MCCHLSDAFSESVALPESFLWHRLLKSDSEEGADASDCD